MNKHKYIFFILIALFDVLSLDAAQKPKRRGKNSLFSIKSMELVSSISGTTFMGDLGGSSEKGSRLVKDYDFKSIRPAMSIGLKLRTKSIYAFQIEMNYGYVSGSDKYAKEPTRYNRNLSFRSPIIDLSLTGQIFIGHTRLNNLYKTKTTRGRGSSFRIDPFPYLFAGVGFFHFNPQAKYEGKWVNLQPLGTEGQGLIPGFEKYSRAGLVIPFGIGVRNALTRSLNIGLEISARKTFTDYIDDVSTVYYNQEAIREARGDVAAALSDPSENSHYWLPNADGSGAQRGGSKYKDYYGYISISINYKLSKVSGSRSKF